MARSLQGLVDFVLNEVALCGSQGATLSDVSQAVEAFYRPAQDNPQASRQNVDHRFKSKVWLWLRRNPEFSVGEDREFNHLTLPELEKLQADRVNDTSPANEAGAGEETPAENDQTTAPTAPEVRVFVSEKRTWLAVAGHEPDEVRIPSSEYALLSIIASSKFDGIPQTELIRRSKQDKRSVPKRTDALQRKGYIEKRNIQVRGARTSLCTLRRFSNATIEEKNDQKNGKYVIIDFDQFLDKLFTTLKECRLISRFDLKTALGFEDRWHWRILSRALRKFERIGVLQRVKAKTQYSNYNSCVELLREPTPLDLEMFHEYSRESLSKNLGEEADEEDDEDGEDPRLQRATNQEEMTGDETTDGGQKSDVVGGGRMVPSWTPDRNMCNLIFEAVDNSGTTGITNLQLNRRCYGHFYKRPAEALMSRLVNCWQLSQPPELRRFSIVRDTDVEKTVLYYVHYSFRHFKERVDNGTSFWEAVVHPTDKLKPSGLKIPAIDAPLDVDEHGLPNIRPYGLMKNGKTSRFEGLAICKPIDYRLTSRDPMPFIRQDGSYRIAPGNRPPPGCSQYIHVKPYQTGRPKGSLNKTKTPKRKRSSSVESNDASRETPQTELDGLDYQTMDDSLIQSNPPARKSKYARFDSLPDKERFEAMGMDENWTEYKALIMEKPKPGVYVTPVGRKRATGNARGRPRISRIAVFKSPRLADFPWFMKDDETLGAEEETSRAQEEGVDSIAIDAESTPFQESPAVSKRAASRELSQAVNTTPSRSTRNKRQKPSATQTPDKPKQKGKARNGRVSKSAARTLQAESASSPLATPTQQTEDDAVETNGRLDRDSEQAHSIDEPEDRTPKRRRVEKEVEKTPHNSQEDDRSQLMPPPPTPSTKKTTPKSRSVSVRGTPSIGRRTVVQSPRPYGLNERSGTVNILRRNIVMEIIDAAGGAYPANNEIWYPFTAKWAQLNYKERPDTRTIKMSVKQLVDAGKLRRMTFSGKDPKGIMVTKELLVKPEMSPDDPVVKEMQQKLLSYQRTDASNTYSPFLPTSGSMRKNPREVGGNTLRGGQQKKVLPVISHATVQLRTKPAFVVLEEQRKAQRLERELQKRLARDIEGYNIFERGLGTGVPRLMSLNRPQAMGMHKWAHKARPALSKRLVKAMSTIGPMAMMMNPGQWFNENSGTFGTISIVSDRRMGKRAKQFSSANPQAAVDNLMSFVKGTPNPAAKDAQDREDAASEAHYKFFQAVDKVSKWEAYYEDVFRADLRQMPFIEHSIDPQHHYAAPVEPRPRFYVPDPRIENPQPRPIIRRPLQPQHSNTRFRPILPASVPTHVPMQAPQSQPTFREYQFEDNATASRRPRILATLPEEAIRKFMVAIVAVRTLAGGNEGRTVEWELVQKAFPNNDLEFVQVHGKSIVARNRMEILKMQRDFQESFLEAYEKNEVPTINYDDLLGYNWQALVEWATIELEFSTSEKAPTLPATREQFDSVFQIRTDVVDVSHELFYTGAGTTILAKRNLMTRVPFVVEAIKQDIPKRADVEELEIAKTWVRANVMTPEARYDATRAHETLQNFKSLINSATQSLLNDRVISSMYKGRPSPGRNYNVHDVFLRAMERRGAIDADQLRQAAFFKVNHIDAVFKKGEAFQVTYHASDGDYLAIEELIAHRRVEVVPLDVPKLKFGLVDGGYLTRQMDKSKLRMNLEIRPLDSYYYGNPIKQKLDATVPALPTADRKLPLWFDIHGCLIEDLWEKSVSAVIGAVLIRPGVDAKNLATMIKPVLGAWEILLLLEEWLLKVGAVRRTGEGKEARWTTEESWWLVLG